MKHLWVVTAGTMKDNPTELVEGDSVKKAIEQIKFYFDLLFVDCAPVIPVSDPVVLAPELDGLLLVVKAGSTQLGVIQRPDIIINQSHVGVVLTPGYCLPLQSQDTQTLPRSDKPQRILTIDVENQVERYHLDSAFILGPAPEFDNEHGASLDMFDEYGPGYFFVLGSHKYPTWWE
jgi:Mrp family chromosome partitioning ATPase